MKKFMTIIWILISASALGSTWVSNKDHSEILFKVPYMKVSEVTGRFNDFDVEVDLQDGIPKGNLKVKITAASIDTGNKMRDGHLKGSDFFSAGEHPYITFVSDKITKKSPTTYLAEGLLTVKGISKKAFIDFTITEAIKDTWGHPNIFVKFNSSLNRKDFKINWNKTLSGQEFLLGEEVSYSGTLQLQPIDNKTPNSKHMIPDTDYIRDRDTERQDKESAFSKKIRNLINGK